MRKLRGAASSPTGPGRPKLGLRPVLAALGAILVILIFFSNYPATKWGFTYGRNGAVNHARELAKSEGLDTSGWESALELEYRNRLIVYRKEHRRDPTVKAISPEFIRIVLESPDRKTAFAAELYPNGNVAGWERKQDLGDRFGPYSVMVDAKAVALRAFQQIAGDQAANYRLTTDGAGTNQGSRFTWEWIDANPDFQPSIDVVVHRGIVRRAETRLDFGKDFETRYVERRSALAWWTLAYFVLLFVAIVGASVFYTLGAIQHRIHHRFAISFGFTMGVGLLIATAYGPNPDVLKIEQWLRSKQAVAGVTAYLFTGVTSAMLAWVLAGSGVFIAGPLRPKWWSLRLLFSRRLLSRPVGLSLAAGMLRGPVLLIPPMLAAGIFRSSVYNASSIATSLFAPLPLALDLTGDIMLLGLFGILLTLCLTRIPSLWPRRAAITLVGFVYLMGSMEAFSNHTGAAIFSTILTLRILFRLLRRFDLLAVLVANTTQSLILLFASAAAQPSAEFHHLAWRIGELLFGGLAFAFLLMRAPDAPEAEQPSKEEALAAGIRSARDELKTEFGVARRAQREMLPANPPSIPGFALAAHCTPAREVGGDLYDFLPLSGDRLAIAVADVSGKGVPAALYMTLTKGLLAATTQDDLSLAAILQQINGHLYQVCKRKTFVTMALGVLDPAARTLLHARAGHNPTVWRSPSQGFTRLLKASGMGLGINGGKIFARTLSVEHLDLNSGDTLVFYSDGLTEAMNPELDQFGEERLMAVVDSVDDMTASEARDHILADVTEFLDGNHPQDDLTLVVLRVE